MTSIILLNGTSSAGKSTLATELANRLTEQPHAVMSIDNFLQMLPEHSFQNRDFFPGALGRVVAAFHGSVVSFADNRLPVIVDHVFESIEWWHDFLAQSARHSVLKVKVFCPLETLEARERERKDRKPGLAKMQFPLVHQDKSYDIELDTSRLSAEECAEKILASLKDSANANPA